MKKIIIVIVAIIIAVALAGGGFYGGMVYQRSQVNNIRNEFLRSRGLDEGTLPGGPMGDANAQGGRTFFGGGATGEIKSIDGNTLVISSGQREIKVNLSDTTAVQKTTAGAVGDLQPGLQVMVTGERDANGIITAVTIMILPEGSFAPAPGNNP